jgi:cytochrome c-type biogenesis protein CcsB
MTMETLLLKIALVFYLLAAASFGLSLLTTHALPRVAGPLVLLTAFVAHGGSIVARSLAGGYVAVTTDYEALSFFAWLIVGVYLVAQRRHGLPAVGLVVAPLAFMVTLGAFAFYTGVRDLPPNLRSAWLPVHVALAFLGNAVLGLAFCVSLVYLFHERQLKEKRVGALMRRLPSLETLDQLNYRALQWGFPLLTLGILTGALWGKHSWGRFWSWEEREVFSAILWLLYAGLLEARMVAGWRGRRAATVTIIGFAVVLVSFLFGHVLLPGKHGGSFD